MVDICMIKIDLATMRIDNKLINHLNQKFANNPFNFNNCEINTLANLIGFDEYKYEYLLTFLIKFNGFKELSQLLETALFLCHNSVYRIILLDLELRACNCEDDEYTKDYIKNVLAVYTRNLFNNTL